MIDLKPCPWCSGAACIRAFNVFCLKCGLSGPVKIKQHEAVDAWNSLPRAPKWTVYDGTEETLPEEESDILIKTGGEKFFATHSFKGEYMRENGCIDCLHKGDRLMPWPGEE